MKVLVVGSGAREHALCWALSASPLVTHVACAPGNAGIAEVATCLDRGVDDLDGLVALAKAELIDLVVVGPELPLVLGLVDRLQAAGIRAFGPSAAAARLEGSKSFTKAFCARHGIPTATARTFAHGELATAEAYVAGHPLPVVVKEDGLAAGKGVTVATSHEEAFAALARGLQAPGSSLLVESFLDGEEASLFALCDGSHALEFGTAQDHKRALDGDRGPNTGGMGAYSPAPMLDPPMVERVMAEIVRPTLAGMAAEGSPFRGILYVGLMLTADGPKLVEFNVRYGDPECQAVLPRLMSDLATLLIGAVDGQLQKMSVRWLPEACVAVVLASQGYPGTYASGSEIKGLKRVEALPGALVFHAGTRREEDGRLLAVGGRVLTIAATGANLAEARIRAYEAVGKVDWPAGFHRRDIASRGLRHGGG